MAETVVDKETGETYSQSDECLMLEAALLRRELRKLKGDSVKV